MKVMKRLVDAKLLYRRTNGRYGISEEEFEKRVIDAGDGWPKAKVYVEVPGESDGDE